MPPGKRGARVLSPPIVPRLRTPGSLACELGVPLHRVQYILRTRPQIRPSARAGRLRLYSREAVDQIRDALHAIDARQSIGQEVNDVGQD